jgi:integrase
VLHVRRNVQRLPEIGLVFGPPKSNKSRRRIPLPAASAKVLRNHRANQAAEALALGPAWDDLYSHVMPTALREAADAMDRVFIQPN